MSIGKLCPSYEKFGGLYPGCVELQYELCDFYAIIIRICIKIIAVSRRQTAKQIISSFFSPFESDFKPFLELLEKSEKNVACEIQFASLKANQDVIKLQEFDSKKNARFRLDFYKTTRKQDDEANKWRIAKLKRDSEILRSRIRKNLTSIDHLTPWKQAIRERVSGTAEWLCQDDNFGQWKHSTGNTILWCSGAMGVGKTVLTSNVISQLHGSRNVNEIISHHFCCADDKATLSARNITGGLACQLLESQILRYQFDDLQALHDRTEDLDTMEVTELLLSCLEPGQIFYLIIDGLDECDEKECDKIILNLTRLRQSDTRTLKIFIASRPDIEGQLFGAGGPQYRISVTEDKVKPDMELYIDLTLSRLLENGKLKLKDGRLIATISQALLDGSDGI
jgi:Cdc6-like AAA superfamily ATPase